VSQQFFEKPILNSPYVYPLRHWVLDEAGQPTHQVQATRRLAQFVTPIAEILFFRSDYYLGASDPYKSLKTTLKADINPEAWESLRSATSRAFDKSSSDRFAVKVINHLATKW